MLLKFSSVTNFQDAHVADVCLKKDLDLKLECQIERRLVRRAVPVLPFQVDQYWLGAMY